MCSIPRAHTVKEEILLPQIVFDLCMYAMTHACFPQIMYENISHPQQAPITIHESQTNILINRNYVGRQVHGVGLQSQLLRLIWAKAVSKKKKVTGLEYI